MIKYISILLVMIVMYSCGNNNKEQKTIFETKPTIEHSKEDSLKIDEAIKPYIGRYEIVGTDHNNAVENYYVYTSDIPVDKDTMQSFSVSFKLKHAKMKCNINIIDDKSIYPLVKKYPLKGKEYIKVADHLVAFYDFSGYVSLYPFQDIYYKEQGGKNWKKEPIK
ncbi:MAG: hypothetical protein ACLVKO_10220 [Dysgonomonas sp.]